LIATDPARLHRPGSLGLGEWLMLNARTMMSIRMTNAITMKDNGDYGVINDADDLDCR
jgi:hypothetical protein